MKRLLIMFALVWVFKEFWLRKSMLEFLNTLPTERAIEAKIVESERNWPIVIYYREEKK